MIVRPWLFVLAPAALSLFGCTTAGTPPAEPAEAEAVLTGTVSYRARVALPADAVVELWLTDTSPLILAQAILAETTIATEGRQVPIAFELPYDPARIQADHTYGLRAAIRSGSEMLFASEKPTPVITQGNPTHVELWLAPVGE